MQEIVERCKDDALPYSKMLLDAQLSQTLTESAVINECLDELNKQLADNKPIPVQQVTYQRASTHLLKYLWQSRGADARALAQKCPLIASDGKAIRWTPQRKPLVPISVWHRDAQPFAKLYDPERILAEDYVEQADGTRLIVDALVEWDIAFRDPLYRDVVQDLRDERLQALTAVGEDATGVVVTDIDMSQIALLPNQLIQRCQGNVELAKLLLGLVLRHAAVNDECWRQTREIVGRKDRADLTIRVRPALWLADLTSKAWVPVAGEKDGKRVVLPVLADAGTHAPTVRPTPLAAPRLAYPRESAPGLRPAPGRWGIDG